MSIQPQRLKVTKIQRPTHRIRKRRPEKINRFDYIADKLKVSLFEVKSQSGSQSLTESTKIDSITSTEHHLKEEYSIEGHQ